MLKHHSYPIRNQRRVDGAVVSIGVGQPPDMAATVVSDLYLLKDSDVTGLNQLVFGESKSIWKMFHTNFANIMEYSFVAKRHALEQVRK